MAIRSSMSGMNSRTRMPPSSSRDRRCPAPFFRCPAGGRAGYREELPNSFLKSELKQVLDEKGIKELVIGGAMSHMCIDATTRAASDFGYKTTVVHDACSTRDLEFCGQTVPATQVYATLMPALASLSGPGIHPRYFTFIPGRAPSSGESR